MGVNVPIPALYQGMSQQPPSLRAPEQCERMYNGYPSVAEGVRKRPPTQYVAKLTTALPNNALIHQYNRGNGEQYVVGLWDDGTLHVYDRKTGAAKTVTIDASANLPYIHTSNPMDDIGMLTVADTTFIWNRQVVVGALASTLTAAVPTVYVQVKTAQPDCAYTILINSTSVAVQRPASTCNTITIANDLVAGLALNLGAAFVISQSNNLISIRRADHADFTFQAYDQAGGSLMYGFKNRVERYSDLPRIGFDGTVVEVRGQGDVGGKSSFWVKFRTFSDGEAGVWEETVAPRPGEATDLDKSVMPHQLVRQADGTFKLSSITWDSRLVGSTTNGSAPIPSFVQQKIACMFFWRGRLGILSEENVVMSRANSLYNYWPKSASAVNDDDPIDVTVNTTRVSMLRHAVPFQRQLVLFSDNAQFALTGGEILSPKNVRADPITEFDCSPLVAPVSSGEDLFFVFQRKGASIYNTHSGVREYFVNQQAVTNDATDVSAHVPQFIPGNVYRAAVSSTEDLLLLLSKDVWNKIYFYKYLWDGDKRIQSAWGWWEFRASDKILSAVIDGTTAYLVVQRIDGVHLELMELQSTASTDQLGFQVHLDSLTQPTLVVYDPGADQTTFIIPYAPTDGLVPVFVSGANPNSGGAIVPIYLTLSPQGYVALGKWDDRQMYVGLPYEHHHTFSQQYMRDKNGYAIQNGRLQLKYCTINFRNAVTFYGAVESLGRDVVTYRYRSLQLGFADALLGKPVLRSGSWTFPLASKSTNCQFTVINDSPYPCSFYSAEWEGEFNARNVRV